MLLPTKAFAAHVRKITDLNQAKAKVCPQCSQPLKKTATPGTWCQACAYPPCAGCKQVKRPQKGTHHAKHRPFWRCSKCATELCTQCGVRPVGFLAGPGPAALCPQCDGTALCANCNGPIPPGSKHDAWCNACAYPPCSGGCGTPRPSTNPAKYHAKTLPIWTCQHCTSVAAPKASTKKRPSQPGQSSDPPFDTKSKRTKANVPPAPAPPSIPPEATPSSKRRKTR